MRWLHRASPTAHVQGFAAIDLETTGLSPRIDRVVEVAVIQLDRGVSPYGEFATLINPGRDIGATHIHRITARDVVSAPRFEQVAPMLLDLLRGRYYSSGSLHGLTMSRPLTLPYHMQQHFSHDMRAALTSRNA
jgi:DNA polymerase III epsilon subunit-like protein